MTNDAKNNMLEGMTRRQLTAEQPLHIESQFLPERINGQIQSFIDGLEGQNSKFPPERQHPQEDYSYLRYFLPAFVADRNKRASEVNSPEYKEILDKVDKVLPMTTLSVMCMDGRVKFIHVFGFSAGIGSSIRVPGGLLKEYVRGEDGNLKLDEDSNFADLLDGALNKNGSLAEVFDSHYGCAARKGEEASRGGSPEDAGLYSDVLHKREMVRATRKYILENHGDSKQVALIQTTFNPITGFLYMGLETDAALKYAQEFAEKKAESEGKDPDKAVTVYSKEVLRALIEEDLIISTGTLVDTPAIREAFDKHFFAVSWKKNYVDTARRFWSNLSEMKESLLPIFERSLTSVYPELALGDKKTKKELQERAVLLICNAYNAYLHNNDHSELEYLAMEDEVYEEQEHYEYDSHIEEGVKVSEGGYPPYEIPMFVIFSGDEENMPSNIELASGIVRDNRLKKRVVDASGSYTDSQEFAKAPVPVIMQEIIRDPRLTKADWEELENIDWSDMPSNWDEMTQEEFARYVEKKAKLSNSLANGLGRLRNKMAKVFDRNSATSAHLIDQYKVALPLVCDQDRETHAVIPFVKLGY